MCFCSSRESKLNGTRWCVRKTPHFPGVPGFPLTKHEMGKERGEQKTLQGRPTGISHVAPSRCRWCDIPLCPQRSPTIRDGASAGLFAVLESCLGIQAVRRARSNFAFRLSGQ